MNQREVFESNFPRPKDVILVDGEYRLVCEVVNPQAMMHFMEFCARWQGWEAATEAQGVLEELWMERQRQDGKLGGPEHDDQRGPFDWVRNIRNYAGWAEQMADMDSPDEYRRRMVQIAALAVAAVESHDRLISAKHKNQNLASLKANTIERGEL